MLISQAMLTKALYNNPQLIVWLCSCTVILCSLQWSWCLLQHILHNISKNPKHNLICYLFHANPHKFYPWGRDRINDTRWKTVQEQMQMLDMLHLGLKAVVNSTLYSQIYTHSAESISTTKSQENKNQSKQQIYNNKLNDTTKAP